jgi:hypothetical protein
MIPSCYTYTNCSLGLVLTNYIPLLNNRQGAIFGPYYKGKYSHKV